MGSPSGIEGGYRSKAFFPNCEAWIPEQVPEELPEQVPDKFPEEVPKQVLEEVSSGGSEEVPAQVPQGVARCTMQTDNPTCFAMSLAVSCMCSGMLSHRC